MYKSILVAFDGSELAENAMKQAVSLAKVLGAKVTVLYVTLPWAAIAVGEVAVMFPPAEYEASVAKAASEQLKRASEVAQAAGVSCETLHTSSSQPYKSIVDTSVAKGCDLIVMGSHGRRGIAGILLGSVTTKTLTHSHVPVLVYRE